MTDMVAEPIIAPTSELAADPYPYYTVLRETDPVHYVPLINAWMLLNYDDIAQAYKDRRLSSRFPAPPTEGMPEMVKVYLDTLGQMMVFNDPPDHTRLRTLVHKAFTPHMVEKLRGTIQTITDELIDAVYDQGAMDIVRDLAFPLPAIVIAELIGVPKEDRDEFRLWSEAIVNAAENGVSVETIILGGEAATALQAYFQGLIEQRQRQPQDDLLSALIAAEEQGDRLSHDEMISMLILLLIAGYETTTNLISNGVTELMKHPGEWSLMVANPNLAASAVEEVLRYASPVQYATRVVDEPVQLGNKTLEPGQMVLLMQGAGNRSPQVFDRPDVFDITRRENRHLTFGQGIHYCLGAPLARMEGQITFATLAQRMPTLHLAGEPIYRPVMRIRGLATLPVEF